MAAGGKGGVIRLSMTMALIAAATLASACHRAFEEPVSVISMANPEQADQLVAGFYSIEANEWRWTARRFSVNLRPPPGSEQQGATLQLHFHLPQAHLDKLGPITLSADLGGYPLEPETYSVGGSFVYSRDVPSAELYTNVLPVNFCLDKAIAGSAQDPRELGVVVTSVGLHSE